MRILKEYSALNQVSAIIEKENLELELLSENNQAVIDYLEKETQKTNIAAKTLFSLKTAATDVFNILSEGAIPGESVKISCTYHQYYYMVAFEFSEAALPLHTLNKSVKVLDVYHERQKDDGEIGFMNIVHLVNRIALSVDKISETMRISIIKEKHYPSPKINSRLLLKPIGRELKLSEYNNQIAEDFSKRAFQQRNFNADKFIITPGLFMDNLSSGELSAVFLRDEDGNCGGGVVWQKTFGIIVLMIFSLFSKEDTEVFQEGKKILLKKFAEEAIKSGASFVVSKSEDSDIIKDYFDLSDESYNYKSVSCSKRQTAYIKPDLMPLIKKAYANFDVNREIREINFNHRFYEPYSVLTATIDAVASEAVLSILWFGDDLKSNIIRHIVAIKKIGIKKIYFRLDLGVPEEAAVSDLIQSCGFEAEYLWPYSSDKGDIVVFVYYESTVFEMKPCEISPINKSNIDKTPELVLSVYGENYPSKYLYKPEKLWEKIRKRHLYPYIAIDDEKKAVGMISFIKLSNNPYLFEIGQLMVDPQHRGTNVANQLIEYLYSTAIKSLDFDAVLSESVTNHKFSQRSCISGGFCDTALKLNIMSASAFDLEEERRRIGRMSCVVSCIERADETFMVYLPEIYAEKIKICFEGLKPRHYENSIKTLTKNHSITEYHIGDEEADTSLLLNVTICKIGADIISVTKKIEDFAVSNGIKCLLVNIPLGDKYNLAAVEALKENGFFFGGVLPYWFPESDALLMQKLFDNTPDWDSIKLFSRKIKQIARMIKEDIESVYEPLGTVKQ